MFQMRPMILFRKVTTITLVTFAVLAVNARRTEVVWWNIRRRGGRISERK